MVNEKRIQPLKKGKDKEGIIIYWMSRDQRVHDNWALLYAQELAEKNRTSPAVIFNLVPDFLEASIRQYGFMLKGLQQVEKELAKLNIPFFLLKGNPGHEVPKFIHQNKVKALVTDFDPLKIKRRWKEEIASKIDIPFYEVDAHNIIPCFYASKKEEFAAYTFRPKIHKALAGIFRRISFLKKN